MTKFAVQIVNSQDNALTVQLSAKKSRTVQSVSDFTDLPPSVQRLIAADKDAVTIQNKGFRWYATGFLDALAPKQRDALVAYVAQCPLAPVAGEGFTFDALAWIKSGNHSAWFAVMEWANDQKTATGNPAPKLQARAHAIRAGLLARGVDLPELAAQWSATSEATSEATV